MPRTKTKQRMRRLPRLLGSFRCQRHLLPTLIPHRIASPKGWLFVFVPRTANPTRRTQIITTNPTIPTRRCGAQRAQNADRRTIEPQNADHRPANRGFRLQNRRQIKIHCPQRVRGAGKNLRHYSANARDAKQSGILI